MIKNDLGIHTQVISDSIIPMFKKRRYHQSPENTASGAGRGVIVHGIGKIYDFIDNNPMFYFRSSEFVSDPVVVARNDNFVSLSSALEVDLTGRCVPTPWGTCFTAALATRLILSGAVP